MDVLEAEPADSLARAIHSLDSSRERNVFAQAPVALFRILPASFHSLFFFSLPYWSPSHSLLLSYNQRRSIARTELSAHQQNADFSFFFKHETLV